MAAQKITDLPSTSGIAPDTLIEVVDDPGGTPTSASATAAQIAALAPVTSVDGRTGVVSLTDLYATAAQGGRADTAVQPDDLGDAAGLDVGATAGTVAAGDDARLSDARTPTPHASSHGAGGSDPVTLAQSQVTDLVSDLGGKVAASTLTTDGDLITRISGAPARITRGDLASDPAFSSQYAPLQRIAQVVTTAGQSTITFASIPQTFDDLRLTWVAKGASSHGGVVLRFNNDTSQVYDFIDVARGNSTGSVAGGTGAEGQTFGTIGAVGTFPGGSGRGEVIFPAYAVAGIGNQMWRGVYLASESSSPYAQHRIYTGHRRNTDAITRIDIISNFGGGFAAGSTFTLFGGR